ncbi:hypothetical protein B0H19DRAFT_1072681 [Mycena capillaripes]|nr:hypothetical protein B0H19DRAFT_1072681 [Mycena capillaripes]
MASTRALRCMRCTAESLATERTIAHALHMFVRASPKRHGRSLMHTLCRRVPSGKSDESVALHTLCVRVLSGRATCAVRAGAQRRVSLQPKRARAGRAGAKRTKTATKGVAADRGGAEGGTVVHVQTTVLRHDGLGVRSAGHVHGRPGHRRRGPECRWVHQRPGVHVRKQVTKTGERGARRKEEKGCHTSRGHLPLSGSETSPRPCKRKWASTRFSASSGERPWVGEPKGFLRAWRRGGMSERAH